MHPDNVIAQTESSIVYGLGLALTERITIEDGMVQQSNFYDYHVPRMKDLPEIHIKLIQTPNHPTGRGPDGDAARGAGDLERGVSAHARAPAAAADAAGARHAACCKRSEPSARVQSRA